MPIEPTIWTIEDFDRLSEPAKLMQMVREQVIPYEAQRRVKLAKGLARKYYVFGRPQTGGLVVAKDQDGIATVTDRVLLGEFDTEEEALSFQKSLDKKIMEAREVKPEDA